MQEPESQAPESGDPKPARSRRHPLARSSKAARIAIAGGVAAGASFAIFTGVSAAAGGSPARSVAIPATAKAAATKAASTAASSTSTTTGSSTTAPSGGKPGGGKPGGGPGGGAGGPGAAGGGGTITAISGSTLTLRTEQGTETVDTSSTTTYTKEKETITFADLTVGEVVHVGTGSAPTASSTTSTTTATSSTTAASTAATSTAATKPAAGTGTVTATTITVVEPTFSGRVSAINDGTYTVVGADGQLLTVTTTSSTRYYNGTTAATASAISVGSRITAEGTQTAITDLTADLVTVGATPTGPAAGRPDGANAPAGFPGTPPAGGPAAPSNQA